MSILDPKEDANAVVDHAAQVTEEKAPGVFRRLLDTLTDYVLSGNFQLDLRKKDGK